MSGEPLYLDWSLEDRRAAVAFLEVIEQPDFVNCTWTKLQSTDKDGKTYTSGGWPEYDPRVFEFLNLARNTPGIDPYAGEPWEAFWARCWSEPEPFKTASIGEIRRFLLLVKRRERFGDGTIDSAFKKGLIRAALIRLRELTQA